LCHTKPTHTRLLCSHPRHSVIVPEGSMVGTDIGKFTVVCAAAITFVIVAALVIARVFLTWQPA
jgi:hypothetical protein